MSLQLQAWTKLTSSFGISFPQRAKITSKEFGLNRGRTGNGRSTRPPAHGAEIDEAEARLELRFPVDYRSFLLARNGMTEWFGEMYLELVFHFDVVDATEAHNHQSTHPGLVFIGGDGTGEAVGFDFRKDPPVVLVNPVSSGWHEALLQAKSFTELMEQRARGEDFIWKGSYD